MTGSPCTRTSSLCSSMMGSVSAQSVTRMVYHATGVRVGSMVYHATGVCVGSMFSGVLCNRCPCRINGCVPCNWCPCRTNVQWCPVQLVSVSDQCSVVSRATSVRVGPMFSGVPCNWCSCRISAGARVGSVLVPVSMLVPVSDQCWCPCRISAGARVGKMLVPVLDQCWCSVQLVSMSDQCWCPYRISAGARVG